MFIYSFVVPTLSEILLIDIIILNY